MAPTQHSLRPERRAMALHCLPRPPPLTGSLRTVRTRSRLTAPEPWCFSHYGQRNCPHREHKAGQTHRCPTGSTGIVHWVTENSRYLSRKLRFWNNTEQEGSPQQNCTILTAVKPTFGPLPYISPFQSQLCVQGALFRNCLKITPLDRVTKSLLFHQLFTHSQVLSM